MQRNIGDYYNYSEIGNLLGIAPETVRQIERRALAKLRRILSRRGLSASHLFDDVRRRSGKS
jgi:DNA-directed RNA polymerase sigma subunit (sigma70/sigma32)